jgi:hypothetical protein
MRWLGLLAFLACSALQADTVTLKDGQAVSGQIQGYDQYFLDVKSSNGHLFHLPWAEVGAVSRTAGLTANGTTGCRPPSFLTLRQKWAPL